AGDPGSRRGRGRRRLRRERPPRRFAECSSDSAPQCSWDQRYACPPCGLKRFPGPDRVSPDTALMRRITPSPRRAPPRRLEPDPWAVPAEVGSPPAANSEWEATAMSATTEIPVVSRTTEMPALCRTSELPVVSPTTAPEDTGQARNRSFVLT